MQPSDFHSISDNTVFTGKVPDPLAIPVSKQVSKNITATMVESASPGDKNYDDVLEAWMFIHGYLGPRNS